jgi:hypothetical protein
MEATKEVVAEVATIKSSEESVHPVLLRELSEVELMLVGGGIGDVSFV